jgi:nucleoside-diphosphate-sugar epimerase
MTILQGKRILITGGTGLVGSAIIRHLLDWDKSIHLRVPHRSTDGCFINDPRIDYVKADLTRREDCLRITETCDLAVLAAASTGGVLQAKKEPWRQVTDNVVMDSLILEALHNNGVKRIVSIGSASIYQSFEGAIQEIDLDWSQDPAPGFHGVGWAKRYIEKQSYFWHETTGLEFALIRAANIYGPWCQFKPENSNFIAALIRKAVDHQDPFEVWGDLSVSRDILYADDLARTIPYLLSSLKPFEIYNVGSGQAITVGKVVDLIFKLSGYQPNEIKLMMQFQSATPFRLLDCRKIENEFGWKPTTSPEEGILQTITWWLNHKETWER